MYVPCIFVQLIIQPNKCTTYIYIYKQYFIYPKYFYMFRFICVIFRESYPSTLLKLQKSLRLQTH